MTALAARRRQYTWAALAAGLVVLAALPPLTVGAWRAIRDSRAAESVVPVTTLSLPVTPTALLAAVDSDGELASLAVLVLRPEGKGGTIVSVPVSAVESVVEGLEPRPLGAGFAKGGLEQLVLDVESLMNVTIDVAGVVDARELASLLQPLGALWAVVPSDVVHDGDVVLTAGEQLVTPEQAALALVASEEGASEAARLPTAKAVWEAVAADVGAGVAGQRPGVTIPGVGAAPPDDLASFVSALLAGPVAVWQLKYQPAGEGPGNPDGLDLMVIDKREIVLVMATVAPSAVTAPNPGFTFQVDSFFGDAEVTREVIGWLSYFGGNVLLVRELEGTPPEETVLEFVFDDDRVDLVFYEWLLGSLRVERPTERIEGIDIRIVLGKDLLDVLAEREVGSRATSPAATTSTLADE